MTSTPTSTLQLPVIDMSAFVAGDASDPAVQDACRAVADCLRDAGALIVRDPRVNAGDNARFLDMMEGYFSQPHEVKLADVHPELCYQARAGVRTPSLQPHPAFLCAAPCSLIAVLAQVGATPELVETPRITVRIAA